jgi:AcrR family transcriptional regulator
MRMTRAETQQQTREAIVAAADALFVERGFHASSVGDIAAAAGYTKGAVYSNFAAKEDVFFAVYERRAQRGVDEMERVLAAGAPEGLEALSLAAARRRGTAEDGWLATFFEFWAHVVRRPPLRARFAEIHARAHAPIVAALERQGAPAGPDLRRRVIAVYAMQLGLSLERLTQPELVDEQLGVRMGRLFLEEILDA